MDDIAISVTNVSKNFALPHEKAGSVKSIFINPFKQRANYKIENQHALRDITFDVKKGEFFGIVGRNGSGKSTLLKIIANIYTPTKGDVTVRGRLVPFIELGVGFNPELTGRENTYLNGALMGFSTQEVDEKYNKIVDFSELDRFMDQKLKNYSSGMQVRLAFSVATILADSEVLLIDEVLAVGDSDFQRKCFQYFQKLKKEKKTVIFVSHDMSSVREYCDRALLIDNNRIVAIGQTEKVAKMYDELFLSEYAEANEESGSDSERWGSGEISTEDITVKSDHAKVTIMQKIVARNNVNNPIIGIRIRDGSGHDVTGTNTRIEKVNLGNLRVDEKRVLKWVIPNIFADGKYYVDPAILLSDGVTTADWWNEAATFTIKKNRQVAYSVDPGITVSEA